ncbi:MAG: DUF222 domain-containing protein [Vicinamibacterales bacterium]
MAPVYPAVVTAAVPPEALVAAEPCDGAHAIGEAIAALAARLHAATYELLVLLHRFDSQQGWNSGFLSCAHWLHWRTGIDLGAAREKVRVARALPTLPAISAAMACGQLSYAKVRALTRVAMPANECALLDVALAATAAHVERFVRAWRRVDEAEAGRTANTRHLNRQLATWVDDDGMVVIRGRLTPEVGAVVQRALEAAADRLFRDAAGAPTGDAQAEDLTPSQRRADAIGLLAEVALSAGLDAGTAGDRYQVIVHVSAETPNPGTSAPTGGSTAYRHRDAVVEVDHGALNVSAETYKRLACDASVVRIDHDPKGNVLDVGRKTRTVPPSIRRALAARDRQCRFPACTSRRCDAHHLEHWAEGGATSLDNLVLLCRRHHRAVHEGGGRISRTRDGRIEVVAPNGWIIPTTPLAPVFDDIRLPPRATRDLPVWEGTPFDVAYAIDVLRPRVMRPDQKQDMEDEGCGSCGNRSGVSKELVGAMPV